MHRPATIFHPCRGPEPVLSFPLAACFRCGTNIDPLRSPARIVGTTIVSVCRACAAGAVAVVSVAEADVPGEPAAPPAPPAVPARPRRGAAAISALAIAAAAAVASLGGRPHGAPTQAMAAAAPPPPPPPVAVALPPEPSLPPPAPAPPPVTAPRKAHVPGLPAGACVFPLPSADRALPVADDRVFGADRPGESHAPECGGGHCGVDLADAEGTPVLAVRDGVVDKIVRRSDEKGGRWVLLHHAGDMATYYMHLDDIRDDLAPGTRVAAGERIGTLGRSGIKNSAPHLHFAITVNDGAGEIHVDPMPFLRRAARGEPSAGERAEPAAAATDAAR